jgi:hypothetical protein
MLTVPGNAAVIIGLQKVSPVPESQWYIFAKKAQAHKVLELMQKIPGSKLTMNNGALNGQDMFFTDPDPNPNKIGVWRIVGTVPKTAPGTSGDLLVAEYAGDLWDRGPVAEGFGGQPRGVDSNGSDAGYGGPYLVYEDIDGTDAQFKWSLTVQQPVA